MVASTAVIIMGLRRSIAEEKEAERRYRVRARTADPVTARLYRHIADEERVHAREFTERMNLLARSAKR